jgi:hypothetical protein
VNGQPRMTRCHFQLLADAVAQLDEPGRAQACEIFGRELRRTNPHFDGQRWRRWIYGEPEPVRKRLRVRRVLHALPDEGPGMLLTELLDQSTVDYLAKHP